MFPIRGKSCHTEGPPKHHACRLCRSENTRLNPSWLKSKGNAPPQEKGGRQQSPVPGPRAVTAPRIWSSVSLCSQPAGNSTGLTSCLQARQASHPHAKTSRGCKPGHPVLVRSVRVRKSALEHGDAATLGAGRWVLSRGEPRAVLSQAGGSVPHSPSWCVAHSLTATPPPPATGPWEHLLHGAPGKQTQMAALPNLVTRRSLLGGRS